LSERERKKILLVVMSIAFDVVVVAVVVGLIWNEILMVDVKRRRGKLLLHDAPPS